MDTGSLARDRVSTGAATYLFIESLEKFGLNQTYE